MSLLRTPLAGLSFCLITLPLYAGDLDGHTLFRAIRTGDDALAESLLRQGTPANLKGEDGTTALMIAARDGSASMVRRLLEHGADPNRANEKGVTALLWGAGDATKVRLLLAHGAHVNARSSLGNTPLYVAAGHAGNSAAVRTMIRHGADAFAKNRSNATALTVAVLAGDAKTVDVLLKVGVEGGHLGNHFGATDISLLELAATQGHEEVAQLLLQRAAATRQTDTDFTGDALNRALLAQKPTLALRLIEHGADLTRLTSSGNVPPIILAAYTESGDTLVAQAMIDRGVDLSAQNEANETALTWARRRGHQPLIDLLVAAGARESADQTPEIPSRSIHLHAGNQQELLSNAIEKSLLLLQSSSDQFLSERKSCVSCHHQNLPSVAIGWAEDRGFKVDQASVQKMVDRQMRNWERFIDRAYQVDRPVPVPPRFLGYGLWGLSALGYQRDGTTDAAVWYLAAIQHPDGHWSAGMLRPPLGGADIVATAIAMRAMQLYPMRGRPVETKQRVARASNWLAAAEPRYHQELVFRMLGLAWSGQNPDELVDSVQQLRDRQREDGGWSQLPNLSSDAWATSQSLVALHVAGGVDTLHPSYQRGLGFLLRTQFDDGSWFVKARAWPFQPRFESGFPFASDQWISAPATAWAVMAMTLAVEPENDTIAASDRTASHGTSNALQTPSARASAVDTVVIQEMDFAKDIKPLFDRSCAGCHSGDNPQSGYRVTDRDSLLDGGESGEAAVLVGKSSESRLIALVSEPAGELTMPPVSKRDKFPVLRAEEIARLRAWIDAGANW